MDSLRETLTELRDCLADFSLASPSSNSGDCRDSIKAATKALGDFRCELADVRHHMALAGLRRSLDDFQLPRLSNQLLEIKRVPSGTEISGYASVFGNIDSQGEIVDRGAFAASLAQHRKAGTLPLMLWQHDPHQVIGKWDRFEEDSTGLLATGRLLPAVQRAAEAIALISEGAIYGLSIGYKTVRNRLIKKVLHLEV